MRIAWVQALSGLLAGTLLASAGEAKITDIDAFLELCPTDDPVFQQIADDFKVRLDNEWVDPNELSCTSPVSSMPIEEWTDTLIIYQTLRTMYYMDFGEVGHLPWTNLSLYDWMRQGIGGFEFYSGDPFCCLRTPFEGELRWTIVLPPLDDSNRDSKRSWIGIMNWVSLLAHERRHADPDDPGHLDCGCETTPHCDPDYSEDNLGGYGVSQWLLAKWATRQLDVGGCGELTETRNLQSILSNSISQRRLCGSAPADIVVNHDGPECGAGTFEDRSAFNGLWFDASLDGEGFNFIIDESRMIVFYYGYSVEGERLWLTSDIYPGDLQAGKTVVLNMYEFLGGTFAVPEPGSSAARPWGTVTVQIDECGTGTVLLDGIDGEKYSDITPLITTADVACNGTGT